MRFLDLTLNTPAENLALDEALLLEAESGGGEVLRVWEWPRPAVVLGSGCSLAEDVDENACNVDGVPILRRSSGGGTVLLGTGCLLYVLILKYDRDPALGEIRSSYQAILERIGKSLEAGVSRVERAGISDLAIDGRKFSGNAQQRKLSFLLHHGTLLYAFDLSLIPRYLREPARQPAYRAKRDHGAFVRNVPLTADELKRRLCAAWQAEEMINTWPEQLVRELVASKFASLDWIRRR
jgi:lipoate-protein ligase A